MWAQVVRKGGTHCASGEKSFDIIIETTSGNTDITFNVIGETLGHQLKIILPDWLNKERTTSASICDCWSKPGRINP
jgi:hypothetical protein